MINFYLDEGAIFSVVKNINASRLVFNDLVDSCLAVLGSEVSCLYIVDGIYSYLHEGESFSQALFADYGDPEVRDIVNAFIDCIDKASIIPNNLDAIGALNLAKYGGLISNRLSDSIDGWIQGAMYRVTEKSDVSLAIRKIYENFCPMEGMLGQVCREIYKNIYFHVDPLIKDTGLSFNSILGVFLRNLDYLNDKAWGDFNCGGDTSQIISQAASCGVDISPESPSTHRNSHAMRQRYISIGNASVLCEWHTKLTPVKGRIHFHARDNLPSEVFRITQRKVILGVITAHLST